jgi:polar amino acid transport system substrate-binding protein
MRETTRPLILWLCAAALSISLDVAARPLQQVLNEGNLRVGVVLSTPWALRDGGELRGFEIDVAERLAADMSVAADIRVYPWERLIPALEAGEIDLIASGLTITPDRALHVNFSAPYASGGIALATNLASTSSVERLDDLDDPQFKIAAIEGSVAVELAGRILPNAELVLFEDSQSAGRALADGSVDGYLEDEPVPRFLALEHPAAIDVPLGRPLLETQAGFAVSKGDPDFLALLNAWIVARTADTWLPTTHDYWFESLRWREPRERRPR